MNKSSSRWMLLNGFNPRVNQMKHLHMYYQCTTLINTRITSCRSDVRCKYKEKVLVRTALYILYTSLVNYVGNGSLLVIPRINRAFLKMRSPTFLLIYLGNLAEDRSDRYSRPCQSIWISVSLSQPCWLTRLHKLMPRYYRPWQG